MSFISLRGRRSKGRQMRNLEEKNAIVGRGKGTAVSTPLFLAFRLLSNYAKPRKLKAIKFLAVKMTTSNIWLDIELGGRGYGRINAKCK